MTTYSEPYKPIFIGRPLTGGGWLDYYPSPKFATPSIPISLLDAGLPACLPACLFAFCDRRRAVLKAYSHRICYIQWP